MVQMKKKKAAKRKPKKPVVKKTVLDRVRQLTRSLGQSMPRYLKSTGDAVSSVGVIVAVMATVAVVVLGARHFFDDPQVHLFTKAFVGGVLAIASGKLVSLAAKHV